MKIIVKSKNLCPDGAIENVKIDIPHTCPRCSVAYSGKPLDSYFINSESFYNRHDLSLFSLYFCPNCEKCFMVQYSVIDTTYNPGYYDSFIENIYPAPSSTSEFSSDIETLSPQFINIYKQAELSENAGLLELCGLGYRKALEFLVKDYAIASNPNDEEIIKNQMLSPCINNYIDNRRIKTLATASAWIGNDETHYVRKHEDYDLNHLKAFISAIVSYIDSELSFLKAEALLNKNKE